MSERLTSETANVIVVVRMADDVHHTLGRIADACWMVAALFSIALLAELWERDWIAALFMAFGVIGFGLQARDTGKRRAKYGPFIKRAATPTPATPTADRGETEGA